MKDAGFLAQAVRTNTSINPVAGEALQKIVGDIVSAPEPLRQRLGKLLEAAQ